MYPKYFPPEVLGRLARTTSFLVKHSSTADGEETTTTSWDPNRTEKMGPRVWESFVEGAVERLFDEVEVADDRKGGWAWREVVDGVEFS